MVTLRSYLPCSNGRWKFAWVPISWYLEIMLSLDTKYVVMYLAKVAWLAPTYCFSQAGCCWRKVTEADRLLAALFLSLIVMISWGTWKGPPRPDIWMISPSVYQRVKEAVNLEVNIFRTALAATWVGLFQQCPAEEILACKLLQNPSLYLCCQGWKEECVSEWQKEGEGRGDLSVARKDLLHRPKTNQTRKYLAVFTIIQTLSQTLIAGTGNCGPGRREVDHVCVLHLLPAETGTFQARCCWVLLLSSSKISLIKGLIIPILERTYSLYLQLLSNSFPLVFMHYTFIFHCHITDLFCLSLWCVWKLETKGIG